MTVYEAEKERGSFVMLGLALRYPLLHPHFHEYTSLKEKKKKTSSTGLFLSFSAPVFLLLRHFSTETWVYFYIKRFAFIYFLNKLSPHFTFMDVLFLKK